MTTRGWTAERLPVVDSDDRLWSVAEASRLLGEPQDDVRWLIRRLGIQPVGTYKQDGPEKRGRQPRVYRAIDLIKAFDALAHAA